MSSCRTQTAHVFLNFKFLNSYFCSMNRKIMWIVFLGCAMLLNLSFELADTLPKRVFKELSKVFETEQFVLQPIKTESSLNAQLPQKITGENLYQISIQKQTVGYAFFDQARSKTAQFDYLVIFNKDLSVRQTKILVYREEYGGEIGSRRWLSQFNGKSGDETLEYQKNIDAISGATISARSMTIAMNNLLKTIVILKQKHLFDEL